ncbi:hypothetical protein LEMLEM_LOCUS10295 [Lemmus lemmus]
MELSSGHLSSATRGKLAQNLKVNLAPHGVCFLSEVLLSVRGQQ